MDGRQPRALFGNAAFEEVAGSELVILEIAEELLRQGWSCDITAWIFGGPMQRLAQKAGIGILPIPAKVRPFTYDLVWLQNRLEPVLNYAPGENEAPRTLFAFAHLDRTWDLAQPGVIAEQALGGIFVVTAEREVERVVQRGLAREKVRMFRNAAPAAFDMPAPATIQRPKLIFIVSNHAPTEVLDAASQLRDLGVAVEHWGQGGDWFGNRLLPADLARADAVITIGKTASYAIRAKRAAYIYDHFGGPGWLLQHNFATISERNFSGLCCQRRLDGPAIVAEIMDGYSLAAGDAARGFPERHDEFRLETFLDGVLRTVSTALSPHDHRRNLAPHGVALKAEESLAAAAGHYFAATMRARRNAAKQTVG